VSADAENFRLAVLNPGGRDPEQHFPNGAEVPDNQHAPVNFHAYAACTRGAVFREARRASATEWPVLILLRGDFRGTEEALRELRRRGRIVAVAFKESGGHQIASQLNDAARLARFTKIVSEADGCIAGTPETAELFLAFRKEGVAFVATPYPIEAENWNFSTEERSGIFVGTRELDVPSRNHLAALLAAKRLSVATNEPVTVYNSDRRKGQRLIAQIGFPRICVHEKRVGYCAYLRQLAGHKIVFQLDRSRVPGQVAGDTILARSVCVGGDGAIERITFPETSGDKRSHAELIEIALKLLNNPEERRAVAERATKIALEKLSFRAGRENLARFFAQLG
jgi:hypothetical protein